MFNPVWRRIIYSCTHTATVGVKGLITSFGRLPQHPASSLSTMVYQLRPESKVPEHPNIRTTKAPAADSNSNNNSLRLLIVLAIFR